MFLLTRRKPNVGKIALEQQVIKLPFGVIPANIVVVQVVGNREIVKLEILGANREYGDKLRRHQNRIHNGATNITVALKTGVEFDHPRNVRINPRYLGCKYGNTEEYC